jgi:hypothetical protein
MYRENLRQILDWEKNRESVFHGVHRESVSALSAGAYTATLYVMVSRVKGGLGVQHHPHQPRQSFPS